MRTDAELLRCYADECSEAAYSELVQRHLGLVYFAALRQLHGDAHAASDVTQMVFTDLARKAASLADRSTLVGWLHTSTRFAAAKVRRANLTRRQRELEASIMETLTGDADATRDWERLRPIIDDVLHELGDRERELVLLRFFENRPFADIGATLRISEDAARMRVERALQKLRAALQRRGVESTAAAVAFAFAPPLGAAPPVGLAASVLKFALVNAAAPSALSATATFFMAKSSTFIVGAVAVAALMTTFFQWSHARRVETELAAVRGDRDRLQAQLHDLNQTQVRSSAQMISLQAELDSLKAARPPITSAANGSAGPSPADPTLGMPRWLIQQAALSNLKQIDSARNQYKSEAGNQAASVSDLVGEGRFIKTLRTVAGENYSQLSCTPGEPLTVTTPSGITVTYDPSGATTTRPDFPPDVVRLGELAERLRPSIQAALKAYVAAHNGGVPPDEQALMPYFADPKEGADYVEAWEAKKAAGL